MEPPDRRFVVCVANSGAEDLELRKLYVVLADADAAERGFIRVVDESGEDYLYPSSFVVDVAIAPPSAALLGELVPS